MNNKYLIEPRNPAHSILIQMALFKLGYQWEFYDDQIIRYSNCKFLTIKNDGIRGLIDWETHRNDLPEVTFERGVFSIKHCCELVADSRKKWEDEMDLNQGLIGNMLLNKYRMHRNTNDFRVTRGIEQICEYTLWLEKQLRESLDHRKPVVQYTHLQRSQPE